ncbi:CHAT domain-containing protein [Streptomyces sp. NPDC088254]|uniref:CHAT domain-containing protein n=1 Tax=Streptomyces sp. NPDC088254 TaxID=3365847 RepID=UPI0038020FCF
MTVLSIRQGQFVYDGERGLPSAWTWTLERPGGAPVLTHTVRLDRIPGGRQALADLRRLPQRIRELRARNPDDLDGIEDELRRAGEWLAGEGLGGLAKELADVGEVAMRLPPELAELEALPWELALVRGESLTPEPGVPLALHRTTLVRGVRASPRGRTGAVAGRRLRVLALFSLAEGTLPLDLTAHRDALRAAVLAGTAGREVAAHVRTLQFGVGPTALGETVGEDGDWDVVHIVCHGLPGGLLLERDQTGLSKRALREDEGDRSGGGSPSVVGAGEVGRLLAAARGRLKLLCLTACWSGGEDPARSTGRPMTSLAATLADELDCAVVAMRFPVGNDFAVRFDAALYQGLLGKGWPLPAALRYALRTAADDPDLPERALPLLSACTPVLFGTDAPCLTLAQEDLLLGPFDAPGLNMAGPLPDPPEPFVAREQEMSAARAATSPSGASRGAVLHGAAGLGSTSCAAVLAHRHQQEISPVLWHPRPEWAPPVHDGGAAAGRPPAHPHSVDGFLAHLAHRLPACEDTLDAAREEGRPAPVEAAVGCLAGRPDLLLVLDGVDRLLRQDPCWPPLLEALAGTADTPRILLTSRTELPGIAASLLRVRLEPLPPARLLPLLTAAAPRLRALLDGNDELAWCAYDIAAGNPGLLVEADRAAIRRQDLRNWVRIHGDD